MGCVFTWEHQQRVVGAGVKLPGMTVINGFHPWFIKIAEVESENHRTLSNINMRLM